MEERRRQNQHQDMGIHQLEMRLRIEVRDLPQERKQYSLILVDPLYNPMQQTAIGSATKLAPGVTIAKFLGAHGDRTHLNHIVNPHIGRQIARNLSLHAEALRTINNDDVTINVIEVVSEGLYEGHITESW